MFATFLFGDIVLFGKEHPTYDWAITKGNARIGLETRNNEGECKDKLSVWYSDGIELQFISKIWRTVRPVRATSDK
jgi:hypothetical protein